VGGREEIPVDVRVVCATNQNLDLAISEGRFREDLFYRVSEITIEIPPLREREGGRLILARTLLAKHAAQSGRALKGFTPDAQTAIQQHDWPGNVREMENKIKGAVIMADSKQVGAADLGLADKAGEPEFNLRDARRKAESAAIQRALVYTSGNISKAANMLGVTRPTLYDLLNKYEIEH
jgi:two-component system NtrC family response regulator